MKLNKFFSFILMAASALTLSAQGIEFMPEGSLLQQALDKAKQENKMVFLDCYTSWCGPCKMMSNTIFPTQEVGDFMNPKFVSIKIDMEKGEGPALAKRLQVNAYPTFIIFKNDGTEAARFVGGSKAQEFIKRVNDNLGDNGPAAMEAKFKAGDRDPKLLIDYADYLGKVYRKQAASDVAEIILEGKEETFAADTTLRKVFLMHIINPYAKSFIYAAKNPEAMKAVMGEEIYNQKIGEVVNGNLRTYIKKDESGNASLDNEGLDKFIALLKDCNIPQPNHYRYNTIMMYASFTNDWSGYMDAMEDYVADKTIDMTDMAMAMKSGHILHKCKDEKVLARLKKMVQTRLDDIKSGRRAEQTFPENRKPKQSITEMLENTVKTIDGQK